MDSRTRIGRWKDAVSRVQSARKKKYWRRMGCVARKLGSPWLPRVAFRLAVLLLVEALPKLVGKGESGSDGDDGVAFSMRAHVR